MTMKKIIYRIGVMATALFMVVSCNPLVLDELIDPNNPSVESVSNNATREQIQFLITGLEARHRNYVFNVTTAWGVFGRELYYLNGSDPRFQTDWLGQGGRVPDRNYFGFGVTGGGSYALPYQTIKQAEVLIRAVQNTSLLSAQEKNAVSGFAKTIMAYQYMIPANFVYNNGIRIDVADPLNPGPYVPYQDVMTFIKGLLDEASAELGNAGSGDFPFRLTSGFNGFNTIATIRQMNRAIAARTSIYREQWQDALDALNGSFMDLAGDLNAGPRHTYGGPPDIFNPLFFVLDANINTLTTAHPSLLADTTAGDKRVRDKLFRRANPVTITTDAAPLVGTYQDRRWATNASAVPFIKNEELILIKAEAHARLNQPADAVAAINIIRNAAEIGNYTGAQTQEALINEILYQRRYSLWAEPWGHRWIDMRRYNRLDQIDTSADGGTIFTQFPHPQSELNWDAYVGN